MKRLEHPNLVLFVLCFMVSSLLFAGYPAPIFDMVARNGSFAAVFLFLPVQVTLRIKREIQKRLNKDV